MKLPAFLLKLKQYIANSLVIKGTIILIIAGFSTRIIGFYNRIFLSGLIGATEMGIYQLILPLYMVAFAFTTYGNELALTKLVSEYNSRKEYATVQSMLYICFTINLLLGFITATIIFQNAHWLCTYILKAPECTPCLRIVCLGIPFMAMKGAIHGYFLGLKKSSVHGISDFCEQAAKVFGLYLLANYICEKQHFDAAFALWGVVIGEIVAFLYSILALINHIKHKKNQSTPPTILLHKSIRIFLKNSIPLTTNRLALTTLQSIESIMIPATLLLFYNNSTESLAHYGVFTGMAFPFIMFPSTITNALSTMLLPAVSSAQSTLDKGYLSKLCEKSMHFCLLIGLFSAITFYMFGDDIGFVFFQNKEAGTYLYQLSFLCPLIYLATTLASILNGLGYATYNLLYTIIATIIRISFIQLSIPTYGMLGYIMGLFVSYLFLTFACLHKVQKQITFRFFFFDSIFLPGCTFTILGACFYYLYQIIQAKQLLGHTIILLIGIIVCFGIASIPLFWKSICKAHPQPH